MKQLLIILIFLSNQALAENTDKDYSILKNVKEVELVLKQCSRMTPSFITSYNKLDDSTVLKIEKMLPEALKKLAKGKNVNLDDYYRQYASFGILRREIVYVNAIHKDEIKKWAGSDPTRVDLIASWRDKAISVCGGETNYWGALYDSQNGKVNEILFNTIEKKK